MNATRLQATLGTLIPMVLTKREAAEVTGPFLHNRALTLLAVPVATATGRTVLQMITHARVALHLSALVALVSFAQTFFVTLLSTKPAITNTTDEGFGSWRKTDISSIGRRKKDGILTFCTLPLLDCAAQFLVGIGKVQNGLKVTCLLCNGSNGIRWEIGELLGRCHDNTVRVRELDFSMQQTPSNKVMSLCRRSTRLKVSLGKVFSW